MRLCLDARKYNEQIIPDRILSVWPMSMEKIFSKLKKKKMYQHTRFPKRILESETAGKQHKAIFISYKWQKLFIQTDAIRS